MAGERKIAAAAALALAMACALSNAGLAQASEKPGVDLAWEVPTAPEQMVHVQTRDLPAGGSIPWHTHPGVEIAYVESGRVELKMAGGKVLQLEPGGHFVVPRGVVHAGRNIGEEPARLVLTYVIDKGAALRIPADPPEHEADAKVSIRACSHAAMAVKAR